MKDTEIREVADNVLARFFKGTSFRKAEVRTELAFDGAPFVQVDAHFERRPHSDPHQRMNAMVAIQDKLSEAGDDRFVSLTIYSEDERLEEDDDDEGFSPPAGVIN